MAKRGPNFARIDTDALVRAVQYVEGFAGPRLEQLRKRAFGTLARRLPVLAASLIATEILNVRRVQVSRSLSARVSPDAITLFGLAARIPLAEFNGAKWAQKAAGATVQTYRDEPPRLRPHVFAIKGRGVKGGLFMRVPEGTGVRAAGFSPATGLAWRTPIVERRGPSIYRAVVDQNHGDIYPALVEEARQVLIKEVARLAASRKR